MTYLHHHSVNRNLRLPLRRNPHLLFHQLFDVPSPNEKQDGHFGRAPSLANVLVSLVEMKQASLDIVYWFSRSQSPLPVYHWK